MGKAAKVAGGMAAAGGALQAGKMVHNAIKPKEVSEYDDYDCDEGVIGKTVKYGFAAGAALGAGKMARDAIKNRKTVSEYDDYDCDEGVGTALMKVGGKSSVLKRAGDAIKSGASKLKSKAGAMKNSLKTDYVSKGSALKVAAGTAAAGAAAGAVAGSKLAGKKNESLAAAMNGGRMPRRARSVSVQESALSPSDKVQRTYCSMYPSDELGEELNPRVTFRDLYDGMRKGKDFYKMIGEGDSVIRERIFEMLSDIYGVKYNDIYNMWLNAR